ncbi:Mitochondrial trans 2 enoyl coenzyme A reductase [Paragonimus heterotremus]|uniref:Mitochondrial trans 2 enoyl coenzyme A reductase n=1 Tax=Paragonimus heterotremus TaxID=100268 RepID=A0A8J4SGZ5_9TREM|nr:Mitochondrial trans 2 enoyl coenzyme A reductase [Paragonimus heterotremus]
MPISQAAVFRTNPGTAYRMLVDFVQLRSGDVVIQNGATSAVGIYVIQMAKLLGTKTINLFRPRETPEATEKTRQLLLDYGADWALTEAEFNDVDNPIAKDAKTAGSTRLALNCLGGKPALVLLRTLADSGTLVSYGAMTRNPMTIPVGPLIFRDIRLRGFWMTSWIRQSHASRVDQMFKQLCDWFSQQQLKPSPSVEIPFADWKQAIALSKFGDTGPTDIRKKVILKME